MDAMSGIMEVRRRQVCTPKPGGGWLCVCGGELADQYALSCDECHRKAKQAEVERERVAWVASKCSRLRATIPNWEHTKSADAFAKVVTHKSLRTVAEHWTLQSGSVFAIAPSGAGKSSMALRIVDRLEQELVKACLDDPSSKVAHRALDEFSRTVWLTAFDLIRALGPYGTELAAPEIERAVTAPLLILDELGPEPAKHAGFVFDVIDRRYAKKLPTIATSGLTFPDFTSRYGDALPRRLYDKGVGRLVDLHPQRGTVGQ